MSKKTYLALPDSETTRKALIAMELFLDLLHDSLPKKHRRGLLPSVTVENDHIYIVLTHPEGYQPESVDSDHIGGRACM